MARVIDWNGKDLPSELSNLPAGRYSVEAIDVAPDLTDEEEAGIQAAIDSVRAGRGVGVAEARQRIDAVFKR